MKDAMKGIGGACAILGLLIVFCFVLFAVFVDPGSRPAWHVGKLNLRELGREPIPEADECLRSKFGFGLMEAPGFDKSQPHTILTVLGWRDGHMKVVLGRDFVIPLDSAGQPYGQGRYLLLSSLPEATQAAVPANFTAIAIQPGLEGNLQCMDAVRLPITTYFASPQKSRLVGIASFSIGTMNRGSWGKSLPVPGAAALAPALPIPVPLPRDPPCTDCQKF